jgi:hypothetical protein
MYGLDIPTLAAFGVPGMPMYGLDIPTLAAFGVPGMPMYGLDIPTLAAFGVPGIPMNGLDSILTAPGAAKTVPWELAAVVFGGRSVLGELTMGVPMISTMSLFCRTKDGAG